jgi:hypothetical protein
MKRGDLVVVVNRWSTYLGSVGQVTRVYPYGTVLVELTDRVNPTHRSIVLPFGCREVTRVVA